MHPNIVILAGGVASRMKKSALASGTPDADVGRDAEDLPKGMICVSDEGRPFLDYLLYNIEQSGYRNVVIVIGERDTTIRSRYEEQHSDILVQQLNISFVVQKIPAGKHKPLGTADALLEALKVKPEWKHQKFTVCNSDNLYSVQALRSLLADKHDNALIDYDRSALKVDESRIAQYAVMRKDAEGFLEDIVEKPSTDEIIRAADTSGRIGVSMNIFRFSYESIYPFLETVPLHPVRQEKELSIAVKMMIAQYCKSIFTIPLSEHVPDLTVQSDIADVKKYIEHEFQKHRFSRQ